MAKMQLRITKQRAILIGFLGVAVVSVLDAAVGFEISLLTLHVIPVLFVTWFVTRPWGIFFAAMVTLISIVSVALTGSTMVHSHYRYLDLGSDFIAILLLVFMQARLKESYEQVNHQANYDVLTGCLNRRGFCELLQDEIDRQKRYGHSFSIIYFDCDNFKAVNDIQGHHEGDSLLSEIGHVLRTNLRAVDAVGRLGGDEFAVLLPESGGDSALITVQQMKSALDASMQAFHWPVSFSVGIASFDLVPSDAENALRLADDVMYEVKKQGKNGIRIKRF